MLDTLSSDPVSDRRYYPSLLFANDRAARVRIALTYGWRHRRFVHPHRPRRFTDWIQWRKLYDRDPRMPAFADKVAVKRHVAETLGEEWVTPTLFEANHLPETAAWAAPFVVKSRHGCNQRAFVRTGDEDWGAIRAAAQRWVRGPYGQLLDEWLYEHVPTGVLVEPFIGPGGALPIDYKIYVFSGRAACVKVDRDREHGHWRSIHDLDWRPIWSPPGEELLPPPQSLGAGYTGKTSIGCIIAGLRDGRERRVIIWNVCDHAESYREVGAQAVSYTTGVSPVVGAIMMMKGVWTGRGVFNVEELPPRPFLDEVAKQGLPWHMRDLEASEQADLFAVET